MYKKKIQQLYKIKHTKLQMEKFMVETAVVLSGRNTAA